MINQKRAVMRLPVQRIEKTGGAGGTASCQGFRDSAPKPCATVLFPQAGTAMFAGTASKLVFVNDKKTGSQCVLHPIC